MGRSRFRNHWMERPEFVDWLHRDSNDVFRAYCRVCQLSFDVKNMSEGAVKCHGAEAKHVANMAQSKQLTRTTNSVSTFFMQPTMDNLLLAITFIVRTIEYIVRTLQQC